MLKVIEVVFLYIRYCLCIWYICKNVIFYLLGFVLNNDFMLLFKKCMYKCDDRGEFDEVVG